MKKYILAIDQGTTSTRAILISQKGQKALSGSAAFGMLCSPNPAGWNKTPTRSGSRWWTSSTSFLIVSGAKMEEIASIGITNQRETTIVWDKKTGKAIYNAIVWQSKETQEICERYKGDVASIAKRPAYGSIRISALRRSVSFWST
jgi:glycerol kinase